MAEFESAHGTVTSSGLDGFDDVAVGHWTDAAARTGVTVVVLPEGSIGSAEVRGGAPATREFDVLAPTATVQRLDLSLIHISEPTRLLSISYAVFCLKKKKKTKSTSNTPR